MALTKQVKQGIPFKQGFYTPINPDKYIGDKSQIFYRSSWERKFMVYIDENPKVLNWNSEGLKIPYLDFDNKKYNYYPDFWLKVKNELGEIEEFIVEIKPYAQTQKPLLEGRKTQNKMKKFVYDSRTYLKNVAKWASVRKMCDEHRNSGKRNIKFWLITEKNLDLFK